MQIQSISGWDDHILAGRKYLKTATNGWLRPSVFNNELIFQLAAMAIEELIVGVYQYHDSMAFDHTLSGLVDGLPAVCVMDDELAARIKRIEAFDDMCALTPVHRSGPSDQEIQRILKTGRDVAGFAEKHTPGDNSESVTATLPCAPAMR